MRIREPRGLLSSTIETRVLTSKGADGFGSNRELSSVLVGGEENMSIDQEMDSGKGGEWCRISEDDFTATTLYRVCFKLYVIYIVIVWQLGGYLVASHP